jgi:hypothetical protein
LVDRVRIAVQIAFRKLIIQMCSLLLIRTIVIIMNYIIVIFMLIIIAIVIAVIIIIAYTVLLYLLLDRVVRACVVPSVHRKEVLCDDVRTHLSVLHEYKA